MKKLRLLWMIALVSLVLGVSAQNSEKKWAIGINGVRSVYIGDLNDTFLNFDDHLNIGGGITINRYLNRFFDLGLYGSYSKLSGGKDYKNQDLLSRGQWLNPALRNEDGQLPEDGIGFSFKTSAIFNANLQLRWKFLGNDEARWVPFVVVSGGIVGYDKPKGVFQNEVEEAYWAGNKKQNTPISITAGAGLGLEYKISQAFSLRYQADLMWTERDNIDFYRGAGKGVFGDDNDYQFQHSLGIVWSFGKKKDADGDGVKDSKDLCPDTPAGVQVDANGCPIDTDADGVADYLDQCPDTPAGVQVDANGCPVDSDRDGVADYLDQCPNTRAGALVDEKGCIIDADADGVADNQDRCPGTPAGVKVDASGCPVDTDGDGIADHLDKCPNERGIAENDGCPAVVKESSKTYFATNLYNLTEASTAVLDAKIAELKANPDVQVKIEGHTDNTGTLEFNRALANSRANAVRQYLVRQGIDAKRITSVEGFWFSKPIGDNETEEGRAKNRRAEVIEIVK